jgi:hypothetical protein
VWYQVPNLYSGKLDSPQIGAVFLVSPSTQSIISYQPYTHLTTFCGDTHIRLLGSSQTFKLKMFRFLKKRSDGGKSKGSSSKNFCW